MRARQSLGRVIVATSLVTLLSATGAWALAAPKTPSPQRVPSDLHEETPPFDPATEPRGEVVRNEKAPRKKKTHEEVTPQPRRHLLAAIPQDLPITATPGGERIVGEMPAVSPYLGTSHKAWVLEETPNGRYGRVTVPYSAPVRTGWIDLKGAELSRTAYSVHADLSEHTIVVKRLDGAIMRISAATGAAGSPTPTGRYFVVDLVPIPEGGSFGTYAFGLSGIQPNLPDGWTGGNQLAIHGTSDPGSIGTSASAGCLRVSERALDRLKPVLRLGTPVVIQP